MALTVGSLFSGIGGIDLGLERAGMESRWFVEWDAHCQNILRRHWPGLPVYGDITAVDWSTVEPVDVLAGGFPCQPVSNAGKRLGTDDARWLWPEFARAIRILRPRYVLVENVAALLTRGFNYVANDLAAIGYDKQWDCIPAAAVGAPHLRDRLWIVAYPSRARRRQDAGSPPSDEGSDARRAALHRHEPSGHGSWGVVANADQHEHQGRPPSERRPSASVVLADAESIGWREGRTKPAGELRRPDASERGAAVPHAIFAGLEGHERGVMALQDYRRSNADPAGSGWWATEPDVGRVADGVPHRVDRLRALGNAVVPQVVEWIGRRIVTFDADGGGVT